VGAWPRAKSPGAMRGASSGGRGRPWHKSIRVAPGPGAYSAMTRLKDGSIGILTEEGVHDVNPRHHQGYRIWFTRLPLTTLLPSD